MEEWEVQSPIVFDVPPTTVGNNVIDYQKLLNAQIFPQKQFIWSSLLFVGQLSQTYAPDKDFYITSFQFTTECRIKANFLLRTIFTSSGSQEFMLYTVGVQNTDTAISDAKFNHTMYFNPPLRINVDKGEKYLQFDVDTFNAGDNASFVLIGFEAPDF